MMRFREDHEFSEKTRELDSALYKLDIFDETLALDYALSSKLTRAKLKKLAQKFTANMDNPYVQARAAQPFKRYEGKPVYDLRNYISTPPNENIFKLVKNRKSTKKYTNKELSMVELSHILYHSYGVMRTEHLHEAKIPWRFRPIPSPGGLFASELYLLILKGLMKPGLYHYRPDIHSLEFLKEGYFNEFVRQSCGVEPYIHSPETIGGLIFSTSLIERVFLKYGERAYKFMLIETGLLANQLSMIVEAIGLGSCMLGGYLDDEVHEFLGVDGLLEAVQNVMVIGHKA